MSDFQFKRDVKVENRLSVVLSGKPIRESILELASKSELARNRDLAFSTTTVADFLAKNPSPQETVAFFSSRSISEAIILERTRPALLVRDGIFDKASIQEIENKISPVRNAFAAPLGSVGRVELTDHDDFEWCGTAWRIEEDLLITNRHVAMIFGSKYGSVFKFRTNQRGRKIQARVDFREEYNGAESSEFGVLEILWIADESDSSPDIAILKVRKDPGLPPPIVLFDKALERNQSIAVVGYPAKDSQRNDAVLMGQIFGDIYNVKRFSPGEIIDTGENNWYFTHDATTLGGNSGSVIFDIESQKAVGLHFGGKFKETNYAVRSSVIKNTLQRRMWMGVTFESLNVELEAFSEKKRAPDYMSGRAGYNQNFLTKTVNIPVTGESHSVLATGFADELLPYTHFSILMSQDRRLAIYTVENLDGGKKKKLKRKDSWGYDPRIPKEAQVGHNEFYGPQAFDKGHMVRRENPGWGDTEEEASLGEEDSFIYTNAIPQMPQLNQKTWLSLENYVLESSRTEGLKVTVFTGPVFRKTDPSYSGIQVPIDFWKVVVAIDSENGELLTSSYLLSQVDVMPEEAFRFGAFKTYQVPLKQIQELTDLKFSKQLLNADVFGTEEVNEMIASKRYLEVNSHADIVLTKKRAVP